MPSVLVNGIGRPTIDDRVASAPSSAPEAAGEVGNGQDCRGDCDDARCVSDTPVNVASLRLSPRRFDARPDVADEPIAALGNRANVGRITRIVAERSPDLADRPGQQFVRRDLAVPHGVQYFGSGDRLIALFRQAQQDFHHLGFEMAALPVRKR